MNKLTFIIIICSLKIGYSQGIDIRTKNILFSNYYSIGRIINPNSPTLELTTNDSNSPPGLSLHTANGAYYGSFKGEKNNLLSNVSINANDHLFLRTGGSSSPKLTITDLGKIGIKTNSPTTDFEINGYTKLGSDAPAIKVKKFTGTTVNQMGNCNTTVNLIGINDSNILSYDVMIDWKTTDWVKEGYTYDPGQEYYVYHTNSTLKICLKDGNSTLIANKPYRVLVTYEE